MKTWFEPREVLFPSGELDLGFRTLVADFEFCHKWSILDLEHLWPMSNFGHKRSILDLEHLWPMSNFGHKWPILDVGH